MTLQAAAGMGRDRRPDHLVDAANRVLAVHARDQEPRQQLRALPSTRRRLHVGAFGMPQPR